MINIAFLKPTYPAGHVCTKILKIMRLTAVLILISTFTVSAKSYSQKVNLSLKSASVESAFEQIRQQTGYSFLWQQSTVEGLAPVTFSVRDASVDDAVKACIQGLPLTYQIHGNVVYIQPKAAPASPSDFYTVPPAQQQWNIRGFVKDTAGNSLEGALISIEGTNTETHSNAKGQFQLDNVSEGDVLVVSYVGYITEKIKISRRTDYFYIVLRASENELDKTIIQAYGTTSRRFSVGDISKVTAEDISDQPVMNPLAALEGRVPGLLVTTNTGNPGASMTIQIRGQNTVNPSPGGSEVLNSPLFIIDGVPFAPQNNSSSQLQTVDDIKNVDYTSGIHGLSPFNSINPSDIESIEVLKDADATAIYGSRGANGVILITTKRGKAAPTSVNGTLYTGVDHITRSMPLLNTQQYLTMRHEAFANDNIVPNLQAGTPGYAPDLLLFDTTRYTNFLKDLFGGNAQSNSANVTVSGGSNTNTFYIGAGYNRETYVFPGSFDDSRISGDIALHHNSNDRKLSIDLTAQYSYDHNNVPGQPSILGAYNLVPDLPSLRNPDGSLRWYYNGISMSTLLSSFTNPLSYLNSVNNVQAYNLNTNLVLSYKILDGLTARVNMGYSNYISNEYFTYPTTAQNPAYSPIADATASNSGNYTWIIEPQLEYTHRIGKGKFDVLLGNTEQKNSSNNLTVTGSNFPNDLLLNSISSAGTVTSVQTYVPDKYSGSFGRINYVYNNEFIVDLTGRIDGSSRFISGKQWGKFGAGGAGWIFSENKFIKKSLPFLGYGKIRGSYGTTGDDNVGNYQYLTNWRSSGSGYVYNGSIGYTPQNLENPNYSWSLTKKLEFGLDLGFLSNRLLLNASWYRNRSGDQLIQYQLPSQSGFNYVTKNFQAVVQNTGWEFALSSENIKGKKFTWTSSFNLTIARNKLLSFPGLASSSYGNYYRLGQPISTILGYKYAGINDTTGVYQFYTAKGGITYTPSAANGDNKFIIGNTDPKFYGGFRNTISYKGFALDVFVEFRKQSGYTYQSSFNEPTGNMLNVPLDAVKNVWTKPGDHAEYEKLTTQSYATLAGQVMSYYRLSNAVIGDASFVRIKTVGLSYTLNPQLLKHLKMNSLRVFMNAQNLFTFTGYKGNDPEMQNYYGVPPMRTISGGLQFNF